MNEMIAIRPSRKAGLRSREQFIVTFGDVVGLRILSDNDLSEKDIFAVMTATADEDDGRFLASVNQALLIDLARRTAEALGVEASMCRDNYGRDFVKICRIDNAKDASRVVEVFSLLLLEHMQANGQIDSDDQRELREIYEAIAQGDPREDAVQIGSGGSSSDWGS